VAVDARPLAHAPGVRGLSDRTWRRPALGLALLVAATSSAAGPAAVAPDVPPAVYNQAAREGATGSIAGRGYRAGPRPEGPEEPLAGVAVTLVPRSERLLEDLNRLRRDLRDEPRRYPSSAKAVVAVRREYEGALVQAGGADLVRRATSGTDGSFEFSAVPAGPWLLLAERREWVERPGPVLSRRDRKIFREQPRLLGYYAVTFWLREVSVLPGRRVSVELNDRNAWMTGIAEKRTPDADP
jgi:hypothetical protein